MRNALALALLMVMALVTPITMGTLEDAAAYTQQDFPTVRA